MSNAEFTALESVPEIAEALRTLATHYSRKTPDFRDQIALEVYLAQIKNPPVEVLSVEEAARKSYVVADALLAAR